MAVISGNQWELWVDCQLEGAVASNSSNPNLICTEPLTFGNFNLGDQGDFKFYDGIMVEVRIYNRPLNQQEKDEHCNIISNTDDEINLERDIVVYPNPFNNRLNFDAHEFNVETVKIYNGMGRLVFERELNNENRIDLSKLSNGIYHCLFLTDSVLQSVQIIKLD